MNNKQRGELIREYILSHVEAHTQDIAKHTAETFSISVQAVNSHLQKLEHAGWLASEGKGKGKKYQLGSFRKKSKSYLLEQLNDEDEVWRRDFLNIFEGMPERIIDLCHYGFTEMTNNVLDHSEAAKVYMHIIKNNLGVAIRIQDDGEGIFRRIKRLCHLDDEKQAILELSKGKLTTDPSQHSGEGIFFTSRVFDQFEIRSKGLQFSHDNQLEYDYFAEIDHDEEVMSTVVSMYIETSSKKHLQDVFDSYAQPEEYSFNKTVIPIKLAQYDNEKLISRSQAKRVLARVDKFEHVVFDFAEVTMLGQAFADEIFRVYANSHPHIQLEPENMQENVAKMVKRAIANKNNQ